MNMILVALVSALGAIMANKGIAVFNDGLRPIVPEELEGRMTRGIGCNIICHEFWTSYRF